VTRRSRRAVLAGLGPAVVALAGCTGGDDGSTTAGGPTDTTTRSSTTTDEFETTTDEFETTTDEFETTTARMRTTGPPTGGVTAFDEALPAFLREWDVPGAAVAVAEAGQLTFVRGYGLADRERERPVRPDSLFRVGSVAKPITAVTVLDLVERGDLALDDRAFDVRPDLLPADGPADPRAREITVEQLLRHTAAIPGREQGFHPMFMPREIASERGETPPASAEATIRYTFGARELAADPGRTYAYSNVGYCLLGRVIEGVVEDDYASHVRDRILSPLGATSMRIGATRRSGLADREVRYYGHRTVESPFPDVGEVPRPYAAASLQANDANGGWVGSAVDLLRFVRGIDGRESPEDVLDPGTVESMTARPGLDRWAGEVQYYGAGVFVIDRGPEPTLWHDGSLPGSYAFLIHDRQRDLALAALTNSRAPRGRYRTFKARFQQLLIRAIRSVEAWPDRDLFDRFDQ